ncbi:sulfurtransferase [Longimicrobium terrae]|uniref:Thiosulfate/3-mercaptopyruvate sulfurtransferase n=1 Tax=Longimicrobium terrae TaxID=1639882 RepID=A0A841GZG7_9BACT|nr:rhodanese-like domain-containing protein [Longimicrobium terrae]MBB4636796.1 thiosulfate/3-mercaptopyruvate sulfurtransferase [Longimicrobium terrae]MBB6071205.1 thiosulfate/3-mercaptopyruvate sulfurtransferase [Longimicrobium terrae]NNC29252.1 sulfurtransferase [Longimicrobium terrae]
MRKPLLLASAAALVLGTAACPIARQDSYPLPQWNSSLLISPERLSGRLDDPRTVVVHVGRDRASYDAGHIPGARFLALSSISAGDGALPDAAALETVLEGVGISDNSRVVLYGDMQGMLAARAFFILDYAGHQEHALLDGGLERWRADNRPVSTEAATGSTGTLTVRPRPQLVVDAAWVNQHRADSTVVLIDARPPEEFSGATPGEGVTRAGHIPGAYNIPSRTAFVSETDLRLRSPEVLASRFTLADAAQRDTVVVYGRTAEQASMLYFVARYLERTVRLYDASFTDWSRRGEDFPVER